MDLPPLYEVITAPGEPGLDDPGFEAVSAIGKRGLCGHVPLRSRVCVAIGSRGLDRIDKIARGLCDFIRERPSEPFILAAMGSHGGCTGKGRAKVLANMGITEKSMGAEIVTDGDTLEIGQALGQPVHVSRAALEANAIILANRIKPHTSFSGPFESGLCKMMAVGLGMVPGATAVHARGPAGMAELIPEMAKVILAKTPVIFGIAIIDNRRGQACAIDSVPARKIIEREPALLEQARLLAPRLPFASADVLVVERIGKDISGTGMDTNLIGRRGIPGTPDPPGPKIKSIVALGLSPDSDRSPYGIGLADFTTRRLIDSADFELARANAQASTFYDRIKTPPALATDSEAILAAIEAAGKTPANVRLARIKSTAHVDKIMVTQPLLDSLDQDAVANKNPVDWNIGQDGNLAG